jgi:8-oxo-dGTP pyrophosphatase MutT (NUDIX family)
MTTLVVPRPRTYISPPWPAPESAPAAKLLTLVIPRRNGQLLLGLKKRGFGTGLWNGFGGKVEADESVIAGAARELEEECGLRAQSLRRRGTLNFHWQEQPQPWEVAVYDCTEWSGTVTESDEMRPAWVDVEELPYDTMWPDDRHWYPFFLQDQAFEGTFWFRNNTVRECEPWKAALGFALMPFHLQELVKFCILPVTEADLAEEERKHQRTAVAV